MSLDPRS